MVRETVNRTVSNEVTDDANDPDDTEVITCIKGVPSFCVNDDGVEETNFFIRYKVCLDEEWDYEYDELIDVDEYWMIQGLEVAKKYRGRGIARQLMTEAIAKMKAERPELEIRIISQAGDPDTDQEKLDKFYESLGFQLVDDPGDPFGTPNLMFFNPNYKL